jgi:hypothetical protein
MEIGKLKATMQLAKMRSDADPTDENVEAYETALSNYENALPPAKTEVKKNKQVSGKKGKTDVSASPANTATLVDESGDDDNDPDHTDDSGDPADLIDTEQKKTDATDPATAG